MTLDEARQAIETLKKQGYNEEDLLRGFYVMFQNDELTVEDLEGLCNIVGYEITDEFKNMSPEDQKTKGLGGGGAEETSEEQPETQAEDAGGELQEGGKVFEDDEEDEESEPEETAQEGTEDDEEDEEKKAMKLFNLNK